MTQFDFPTPDRHLEDKSKLVFHFNTDEAEGSIIKVLNFMENIEIDERVTTNYAQYTPIGSNGSQFAYLGTKSREFEISFNMTLPHIMENTLIKPDAVGKTLSAEAKRSMFFDDMFSSPSNSRNRTISPDQAMGKFIEEVDRQHADLLTGQDRIADDPRAVSFSVTGTTRNTALIKLMNWVNLIRASCLTNAKQPYLGPPLVRLHHGILYSDIPCLVSSYNITYDHMHGFDSKTMLPRVISVKLSLKEVRLRGRAYSPGANGDYTPGWDSFIHEKFVTLDPNIPRWSN
jgi:hypothetical protein